MLRVQFVPSLGPDRRLGQSEPKIIYGGRHPYSQNLVAVPTASASNLCVLFCQKRWSSRRLVGKAFVDPKTVKQPSKFDKKLIEAEKNGQRKQPRFRKERLGMSGTY